MTAFMKITLGSLALISTLSVYLMCCKIQDQPVVKYEINRHQEKVNEAIMRQNIRAGHDFLTETRMRTALTFPEEKWTRLSPEAAGWNLNKLDAIKLYFEHLNADACMIIQNGYVIAAWGDISEPIEARSMRK